MKKLLSVILALAMVLSMTAVAAAEPQTATVAGFGGDVTLHVSREGNLIRKLVIDTPDETEGLGKKASEEDFINQFIDKEGPFAYGQDDIEAISGATITSNAVLKGLNRLYGQEEKAAETEAETAKNASGENDSGETASGTENNNYQYKSEQETNYSKIRVYANAADGRITECLIESEEKSAGSDFLTAEIKDEWAKAIVEAGSADTDVITGASKQFSAKAVTDAVNEILAAISGSAGTGNTDETTVLELTPEPTAEPEATSTSEPTPVSAEEPKAEEPPESAKGLYGSFAVQKETNFSTIRVYADTKGGKITGCRIESEEKSAGSDFLTDEIKDEWAKAIVENGTAETDIITGATKQFSAAAVIEAVDEILAKAKEPVPAETLSKGPEQWEQDAERMQKELAEAGLEVEIKYDAEVPEGSYVLVISGDDYDQLIKSVTKEQKTEPEEETKPEESAEEPKPEEPADEPKGEEPAESAKGLFGSFTVKKETDYSTIRVYAETRDGKITGCRITSESKSEGSDFLTDEIKDEWARAIVENGTAETDAITGASKKLSAAAVIEAVNEILAKAGAPAEMAEPKDEPAEEPKAEQPVEGPKAEEPAEEPAESPKGLYGSFMVKKETNFSTIRVYIDSKDGKITNCRIESEEKSAGSDFLTDEIKDEWAKAIVENGTAETDVITGATKQFSAAAVIEAVNEILESIK